MKPALVLHGGAGLLRRDTLTPAREARCREVMHQALARGRALLESGASGIDTVEAVVRVLEAAPEFNAGRGAVLNVEGDAELDASIMDSRGQRAGAVLGLRRFLHPISIARALLDDGVHVAQAGAGAEAWALQRGFEPLDPASLVVPERHAQWARLDSSRPALDHDAQAAVSPDDDTDVYGTVGAVALDASGAMAAATSTGGMMNKRVGRVSDSAMIGAGTWAREGVCAVSCTGHGEFFLRVGAAHRVAALMELGGHSLEAAGRQVLDEVAAWGGTGGLIAVDARGNIAAPFNTAGMFHAWWTAGSEPAARIW
jgi:beta-aspartyl-peptidase (threonine type)